MTYSMVNSFDTMVSIGTSCHMPVDKKTFQQRKYMFNLSMVRVESETRSQESKSRSNALKHVTVVIATIKSAQQMSTVAYR